MAEVGRIFAARHTALGIPEMPRCSGLRRTAAEGALLKAGERW